MKIPEWDKVYKPWNRCDALKKGKAQTRDGRLVFNLREAVLDGEPIIVGTVTVGPAKKGQPIKCEMALWAAGGLGLWGGDDLVDL